MRLLDSFVTSLLKVFHEIILKIAMLSVKSDLNSIKCVSVAITLI